MLRLAALALALGQELSPERLALLARRCDDGDGLLSLPELHGCAEAARLGLATKDTLVAMEEMDRDGDKHVSFQELHEVEGEPLDEEDRRDMEPLGEGLQSLVKLKIYTI